MTPPRELTNVNGTIFFVQYSGLGEELWKSDGTAAGTVLVRDINPGNASSYPYGLVNVGGTLFFSATSPSLGAELWKSDGTSAGTVPVRNLVAGSDGSYPASLTAVGSTLYFAARTNSSGRELYKERWHFGGHSSGSRFGVGSRFVLSEQLRQR